LIEHTQLHQILTGCLEKPPKCDDLPVNRPQRHFLAWKQNSFASSQLNTELSL